MRYIDISLVFKVCVWTIFFFKVKCNKLCFWGAKILNIDKRATHKFVSDILQFHKCRGNVNKSDVFRDFLWWVWFKKLFIRKFGHRAFLFYFQISSLEVNNILIPDKILVPFLLKKSWNMSNSQEIPKITLEKSIFRGKMHRICLLCILLRKYIDISRVFNEYFWSLKLHITSKKYYIFSKSQLCLKTMFWKKSYFIT